MKLNFGAAIASSVGWFRSPGKSPSKTQPGKTVGRFRFAETHCARLAAAWDIAVMYEREYRRESRAFRNHRQHQTIKAGRGWHHHSRGIIPWLIALSRERLLTIWQLKL
jgi:hypothetical protein